MIHPALSFFGQGEDAPGVLGTRYVVTGHELKTHLDAVNLRFEQTRDEFNSAYGHKKITDQFRHRWASQVPGR